MAEPTLLPKRLQYRPTKIELDESIEKAKATLLKKIKRSVYVYRVDCGGCNGCEIEIFGSITPVFDVEVPVLAHHLRHIALDMLA